MRAVLAVLAISTALASVTLEGQDRETRLNGRVIALLAEGKLTAFDVATGRLLAERVASDAARYELRQGRLAYLPGSDEVYSVLPDGEWPVLAALNLKTLSLRVVGRLPGDPYPGLAVGPRTKRIYAFGSISSTVVVVDPASGAAVQRYSDGTGYTSFSGAVSADERRIFVSYHGNRSGVAGFDISGNGWRQAMTISSHGNFALVDDTVLATTGGPEILQVDKQGRTTRRIATGLFGNHLMEFALDERRNLYAVGSCMFSGGFTRTTLRSAPRAEARVLVAPGNNEGRLPLPAYEVCGERVSAAPDGSWIVAAALRHNVIPSSTRPGSLLIVDARTGAVFRMVQTSSEVVDVLAIR